MFRIKNIYCFINGLTLVVHANPGAQIDGRPHVRVGVLCHPEYVRVRERLRRNADKLLQNNKANETKITYTNE